MPDIPIDKLELWDTTDGRIAATLSADGDVVWQIEADEPTTGDGAWHDIAVVTGGGTPALHIDGEPVAQTITARPF